MTENPLVLYALKEGTRSLGPFLRFALWVQGCPRLCPGCMTPEARPFEGGIRRTLPSLAEEILLHPEVEGLTLSGGEPFCQAGALASLVGTLRQHRDLGVIVYTGYALETLSAMAKGDRGVASLLKCTDLLIDGAYVEALNSGRGLKGSANQRALALTDRYHAFLSLYSDTEARHVELHIDRDADFLVGVPSPRQLNWWQGRSGEPPHPSER